MIELNKDLQKKHHHRKWLPKYITESGILIETGTHTGEGVEAGLAFGYKKVISIESNEKFYTEAKMRFYEEIGCGKVELHLGESGKLLPIILSGLHGKRLTFFIDAHIGGARSPILEELDAIKGHSSKDHIIMIDDYSDYVNKYYRISIRQVIEKLYELNSDYKFGFEETSKGLNVMIAIV